MFGPDCDVQRNLDKVWSTLARHGIRFFEVYHDGDGHVLVWWCGCIKARWDGAKWVSVDLGSYVVTGGLDPETIKVTMPMCAGTA